MCSNGNGRGIHKFFTLVPFQPTLFVKNYIRPWIVTLVQSQGWTTGRIAHAFPHIKLLLQSTLFTLSHTNMQHNVT